MDAKASSDVIEIENQYYVRAQSSLADNQTNVLMTGDLFAVFDRHGDFRTLSSTEQGLFYKEMRHLSRLVLRLKEHALLLLSSSPRLDNAVFIADLTNPDLRLTDHRELRRGTLHFSRSSFLWRNTCSQRIRIQNYDREMVALELTLELESDFADIFEVRGFKRETRGNLLNPRLEPNALTLLYKGLDGLQRETRIESSILPAAVLPSQMRIPIQLLPGEQVEFSVDIRCRLGGEADFSSFEGKPSDLLAKRGKEIAEVEIYTSNEQFNDWINRSVADLKMLVTPTSEGLYPYAGVPWFSTIFGRDGIVTGLEFLWMCPEIAKGVLSSLSSTQASGLNPDRDAEPGKIVHEMRQSEMANTGEVPFGRYYGSVDSTPLFVLLAAAYYKRTDDLELVSRISPNIEGALDWIDQFGDRDGDGFVEYGHSSRYGLLQQGWKDSQDSVFHSDGTLAEGPIALCEVQGYVYAAKREIADVFERLGKEKRAAALRKEAALLKEKFHEAFWCKRISSYALALDGRKRPCEVRSSNAGQLLFTGLASADHCRKVALELESEIFYSGWGLRTIAEGEARYNPMSYHNGSVWPHDNALIAFGLSGEKDKALVEKILTGLFEASIFFDLHRMPELFCGFPKRTDEAPTLYPVACAPQAWAAGSVFLILQSCLGMQIDAPNAVIRFVHPMLPESIPSVRITGVRVGSAEVSLEIIRHQKTVSTAILDRHGDIDIVTIK
jgi:glycogen debranching enzyme